MNELHISYRNGRPLAAYYYLARSRGKSTRTKRVEPGLIIDFASDGHPLGIEITAPHQVTLRTLNRVLRELGCSPMRRQDFAPLHAA